MFYTRSIGLRPPATVVGTAKDGLLYLEYYQDGLRVVNRHCKMESISFAIPSSDSPPLPNTQASPPPFTTATRAGKAPLKVSSVQLGSPNSKVVSKCLGALWGEHNLKVARSARIPPLSWVNSDEDKVVQLLEQQKEQIQKQQAVLWEQRQQTDQILAGVYATPPRGIKK